MPLETLTAPELPSQRQTWAATVAVDGACVGRRRKRGRGRLLGLTRTPTTPRTIRIAAARHAFDLEGNRSPHRYHHQLQGGLKLPWKRFEIDHVWGHIDPSTVTEHVDDFDAVQGIDGGVQIPRCRRRQPILPNKGNGRLVQQLISECVGQSTARVIGYTKQTGGTPLTRRHGGAQRHPPALERFGVQGRPGFYKLSGVAVRDREHRQPSTQVCVSASPAGGGALHRDRHERNQLIVGTKAKVGVVPLRERQVGAKVDGGNSESRRQVNASHWESRTEYHVALAHGVKPCALRSVVDVCNYALLDRLDSRSCIAFALAEQRFLPLDVLKMTNSNVGDVSNCVVVGPIHEGWFADRVAVTKRRLAPSLLHIQQLRTLGAPLGARKLAET